MKPRALSERMLHDFSSGELLPLLEAVQQDDTLCMELRGTSVNIYYRGGSLFCITESGNRYRLSVNASYCEQSGLSTSPSVQEAAAQLPLYKWGMDKWFRVHPENEKEFQQLMVRINNRSKKISNGTDYYITDMEFVETNGISARFDMVAFKWPSKVAVRKDTSKPSLALIELKYGDGALNNASGIKKHLDDLNAFICDTVNLRAFAEDMAKVFRQKCELGLVDGLREKQYDLTICSDKPEVIFAFAEHKPAKTNLKKILGDIRQSDYPFPIRIASASMMGCGLYADCMETVEQFLQR